MAKSNSEYVATGKQTADGRDIFVKRVKGAGRGRPAQYLKQGAIYVKRFNR